PTSRPVPHVVSGVARLTEQPPPPPPACSMPGPSLPPPASPVPPCPSRMLRPRTGPENGQERDFRGRYVDVTSGRSPAGGWNRGCAAIRAGARQVDRLRAPARQVSYFRT